MRVPEGRSYGQAIYNHDNLALPELTKRWKEGMDFEKFEFNTYASFAVHDDAKA
jgi:hypothetical protein